MKKLNTVNAEYQHKMDILNRINADLDAMSKASGIATIFLDEQLNLTRYTPDAQDVFRLRETDIGRPLEDIANNLNYAQLFEDIHRTIQSSRMMEKQAQASNGKVYLVRILAYQSLSSAKPGIVLSFIDISAMKTSENLQLVIDALPEHIAVIDHQGSIVQVNQAWQRFAKANGDITLERTCIGSNYLSTCKAAEQDPDATTAAKGIKAVLEGSLPRFAMEYPCHSPTEERWFAMEVVAVDHPQFAAVVSHFNISSWKLKAGGQVIFP